MCVIFFYVNSNPGIGGYKLILASNRDEFYARETRGVTKWTNVNGPQVYGGVDLEPGREGGTWLAIGGFKNTFKIGALLNLTGEPTPRNAAGRGMIVSDFVKTTDDCSIADYNRTLMADCTKYSAFNFVSIEIGDASKPARIALLSNAPIGLVNYEEEKCYGFGNSLPTAPFEKVRYGQAKFQEIVDDFLAKQQKIDKFSQEAQGELIESLLSLLKSKQQHWPDAELKRRAPKWGEYLSAINVNISHEGYGSRTHTIILVDAKNRMHFIEETMATLDPAGEWLHTHIEKQFFEDN